VREGVRSSMTCPLAVDGRRVGVLFRSARRPWAYDERQARLHAAMAERVGQAIEKAYRIEQLAAANRAYLEMLGFVSHELKGPLAGIVMEGHLLADGYVGDLTAAQRERVARILSRAEYLESLIRDYLDLARVEEEGGLKLERRPGVAVRTEILERAADLAEGFLTQNEMRLKLEVQPPDLTATCDPQGLTIVMTNLIGNAGKYGRRGGEVRVRAWREGGKVLFSVWNEGVGFSEAERGRLFGRFARLQRPEFKAIKGSGVGLYTAWRIVRQHGGRIRAASEEGRWAEFTVELPS